MLSRTFQPRYADATLACEGRLFMVHRLVLATCSDFFDEIFQQTPSDSTRAVIVLNEARAQDVECLLDYMYCGQVGAPLAYLFKFYAILGLFVFVNTYFVT